MTEKIKNNLKFIWRIIVAHTIAYFIAGLIALNFLDYKELFEGGTFSLFMRPTTDPIVALGPALQIIRGAIMAVVLLPLQKYFTETKYGFIQLGFLILGLSVLSTFSAAFGSIDGFIYTKAHFMEHISGYPEAFLWIFLFIGILWCLYKFEKKIILIISVILLILIILMGIAGYFAALQTINNQNKEIPEKQNSQLVETIEKEGVSLTVEPNLFQLSAIPDSVNVTIFNHTKDALTTGLHYQIEYYEGKEWIEISPEQAFHDLGWTLLPSESHTFQKKLLPKEIPYKEGKYRIIKHYLKSDYQKTKKRYSTYAEFSIENI